MLAVMGLVPVIARGLPGDVQLLKFFKNPGTLYACAKRNGGPLYVTHSYQSP